MTGLLERFIRYVKVNTRSDATSQTVPTTPGQVDFARIIEKELAEIGLSDIHYNEKNGFLTAALPATTMRRYRRLGLLRIWIQLIITLRIFSPTFFPITMVKMLY